MHRPYQSLDFDEDSYSIGTDVSSLSVNSDEDRTCTDLEYRYCEHSILGT